MPRKNELPETSLNVPRLQDCFVLQRTLYYRGAVVKSFLEEFWGAPSQAIGGSDCEAARQQA